MSDASSEDDPTTELKIQAADMTPSIQKAAMQATIHALKTYSTEKHIAESIKQNFDQLYEPTWHCIVGRNWGSCVTHTKVNSSGGGGKTKPVRFICFFLPYPVKLHPNAVQGPYDFTVQIIVKPQGPCCFPHHTTTTPNITLWDVVFFVFCPNHPSPASHLITFALIFLQTSLKYKLCIY